ncbi:PREDICTED: myb family transcription factor EFM-like [Ipomoea nil]|uniref:myb family transcription factor EFM-like n=1 Tax=Ipomoea nil TaxID=35883 RepID=UPI0009014C38|nr:PREDICTED: myb family transcription factor EFM-like [Ipomoea nil]
MLITIHDPAASTNYPEKMRRCQEYIEALEEERRKIQVFQRELPLCLELVTQAIEAYKQQLSGTTTECNLNIGQSECSEQTTSSDDDEGPVLEEFIPLKRASSLSQDEEDDEQQSPKSANHRTDDDDDDDNNNNGDSSDSSKDGKVSKKQDWLRSAQLWNQSFTDPTPKEESPSNCKVGVKRNGSGGAFHPFKREKSAGTSSPAVQTLDSTTAGVGNGSGGGGGGSKKEEKETQSQRKQRRCWSPELHRRFLQALQQLGGSHVATPKQIRELMKVDGLTNDEVKSHLQKYRLHTRRPTPSIRNNGSQQQGPQFVVVGGIWVPPPEYAAAMAPPPTSGEAATSNGIYAPVATTPKQTQQNRTIPFSGEKGGARRSDSPSTSYSTHTTTTSHSS